MCKAWLGDGLDLFLPILFYTNSLRFRGLRDISVVGVFSARESTYSIISRAIWARWDTHSELSYRTGPTSFTRLLFKISLNQQKKLSSHSSTGPKTATTYFALVRSLTERSNKLTQGLFEWMEFWRGECPILCRSDAVKKVKLNYDLEYRKI
jgi:hypothetical protein